MKLCSYVVARDFGFAPNPFFGFCTLATCKEGMRKGISVGDWVVGVGAKKRYGLNGHIVYVMNISEIISFEEYWNDPRFQQKKPNLRGSLKQAFGDNIYHHDSETGAWIQEDSHHTHKGGKPMLKNLEKDTSAPRVLVSNEYWYWGGNGPEVPEIFRRPGNDICLSGQGYKCNYPETFITDFIKWIKSLDGSGYLGDPAEFSIMTEEGV